MYILTIPKHWGQPETDEFRTFRVGVCHGSHCAGRVSVHEHRASEIPLHIDLSRGLIQ